MVSLSKKESVSSALKSLLRKFMFAHTHTSIYIIYVHNMPKILSKMVNPLQQSICINLCFRVYAENVYYIYYLLFSNKSMWHVHYVCTTTFITILRFGEENYLLHFDIVAFIFFCGSLRTFAYNILVIVVIAKRFLYCMKTHEK